MMNGMRERHRAALRMRFEGGPLRTLSELVCVRALSQNYSYPVILVFAFPCLQLYKGKMREQLRKGIREGGEGSGENPALQH